jgi:transcriptional regulator with XRE-family HTH domain
LEIEFEPRRHELGISLGVLAERTGLTASFLSLVERDLSKPSLDSLRSIAEALAVPTFYFSQESSIGRAAAQNPVVREPAGPDRLSAGRCDQ